ncbi:MAG: ABC transporter ATP-binding protein [Thiotrichales bacterium]
MEKTTAIEVRDLHKAYPIYQQPFDRLKEALHPFGKNYHSSFFALKGVNLTVLKGEVVGILGKNGSGKSTLLKIITGVSQPTSGETRHNGKITAMLELGSGFNPELTGIENLYLNGAILGVSRREMDGKIDSILDFAEIGDFSRLKLKTLSSGMKARLAFAAAVITKPDILIIDEVLSVGDMKFKLKSLRKITELIENGATALFVSHDLGAMKNLCHRVIWLDEGRIVAEGQPKAIIERYTAFMSYGEDTAEKKQEASPKTAETLSSTPPSTSSWIVTNNLGGFGEKGAVISRISLRDETNQPITLLQGGEKLTLKLEIKASERLSYPGLGLVLKDRLGNQIFGINNYIYDIKLNPIEAGSTVIATIAFDFPKLKNGDYSLTIALSDGTQENHIQHHWIHDALTVKISNPAPPYHRASLLIMEQDSIKFTVDCGEQKKKQVL